MFTLTIIFKNRKRYDMGKHKTYLAAFDAASALLALDQEIEDFKITRATR